jgi:hypothetical protein
MHLNRLKLASAIAVVSVLVFGNAAQAATTISVTTTGTSSSVNSIQAGDVVDVTQSAPIPPAGSSDVELDSSWNSESLQLKSGSSVTYPEGWSLEYTSDGSAWSPNAPTILSQAVGIRTKGSIESTGSGFKTHPTSALLQAVSSFTGSTGGDGYDLTFAEDRVFNQFHHDINLEVQCHIKSSGNSCTGITVTGYQTPNGASSFYDPIHKKLFAVVMETSTYDFGFMCISLANLSTPALCGANAAASFVRLYNGASGISREYIGSSSADSSGHVWTFNGANYSLMCLDLAAGAACAQDNGKALPNGGNPAIGRVPPAGLANSGRVSAIGAKVYYVTDTKFGCYDPATHALCSVAGVTVPIADQYPPFPLRSTSGALLGACLYVSRICISDSESTVSMSTEQGALYTWIGSHTIPTWNTYNAGQWAEIGTKLYLNKGPDIDASNDVYCFDFATGLACSGFTGGTNVGSQIYAIIADPAISNCLWTNGNMGQITTFNATTGVAGCSTTYPVARMPYSAVAPRMSCDEAGRVTQWSSIHFTLPTAIASAALRVTIYNAGGNTLLPISGFTDVPINTTGDLDLSGLSVAANGTRATIEITAGNVTGAELLSVVADVMYQAQAPQLCFTLAAKTYCANAYVHAAGDPSIADGVIRGATVITPQLGSAVVASTENASTTLAGTYTNTVCTSPGGYTPPITTPPPAPRLPVSSLSLTKTQASQDPTFPGEVVKYSVVAKNDGELALTGVTIADENAALSDCSPALPVASLDINEEIHCTAVHTVTVADVLAGFISNTAQVADAHNTRATSNTVVTKVKNAPAMTVSKKQISASPKSVGDLIRYEIKATNTGNTILSNVMVIDKNAEIQFCGPSVPVTQLKLGASITCEATHKVTAADVAAGQVINIAIAKSDDVVASSETTSSADTSAASSGSSPAAGNSYGQIKSNEVVTRLAGSKPQAAGSKGSESGATKPTVKDGSKPTGELAYTGDFGTGTGFVGLAMMVFGAALFAIRRRKVDGQG